MVSPSIHAAHTPAQARQQPPLILMVSGLDGSGPEHWQTHWEQALPDCHRVELSKWDRPHRNTWVNQLNLAIYRAGRPVVLVGHGLGCLVIAWWAKYEAPSFGDPVIGALLVAPPEVDFFPYDERVSVFAPTPAEELPFPSLLVASRDDPWASFLVSRYMARQWGSRLVDAGMLGHINADAGLDDWQDGQRLLGELLPRGNAVSKTAPTDRSRASGFGQISTHRR